MCHPFGKLRAGSERINLSPWAEPKGLGWWVFPLRAQPRPQILRFALNDHVWRRAQKEIRGDPPLALDRVG